MYARHTVNVFKLAVRRVHGISQSKSRKNTKIQGTSRGCDFFSYFNGSVTKKWKISCANVLHMLHLTVIFPNVFN